MAKDTKIGLRSQMIYQVFVRQYSETHNFDGVRVDLKRIKDLGADILYLLPIHPIGEVNRKGRIGSPYAIKNYREVNPNYGSLDDFIKLINDCHALGLKVMIDVVFNHTAPDSYLAEKHPEWFFKDASGKICGKNKDWWDIVDLDFNQKDLWDELLDTLCYWAKLGVDGYRCDVAPLLPLAFWLKARSELKRINPDFIMLAESTDLNCIRWMRNDGYTVLTDNECYEAFDILYDYDIFYLYQNYLNGKGSLNAWLEAAKQQESRYPVNYIKARGLSNHDQERAAKYVKGNKLFNLVALNSFFKGTTFIYAGDEAANTFKPDLFEIDLVDWKTINQDGLSDLIKTMSEIKKHPLCVSGAYDIFLEQTEIAHLEYWNKEEKLIGLFNLSNDNVEVVLKIKDGKYLNLIDQKEVVIKNGKLVLKTNPVIINVTR